MKRSNSSKIKKLNPFQKLIAESMILEVDCDISDEDLSLDSLTSDEYEQVMNLQPISKCKINFSL